MPRCQPDSAERCHDARRSRYRQRFGQLVTQLHSGGLGRRGAWGAAASKGKNASTWPGAHFFENSLENVIQLIATIWLREILEVRDFIVYRPVRWYGWGNSRRGSGTQYARHQQAGWTRIPKSLTTLPTALQTRPAHCTSHENLCLRCIRSRLRSRHADREEGDQ